MTDNEIIKALECCIKDDIIQADGKTCRECPMNDDNACTFYLRKHTLDLINRQKAEIERLNEEIKKIKHEMSYMSKPNTIGDRHEMGCW